MNSELQQYINRVASLVNVKLDSLLVPETVYPNSIHSLMRYSVFAGGKRIRPCFLIAANEVCGAPFANPDTLIVSSAIEMLHTFSLIHDDLPCMDDDDFRRGKPTAHKAFNEALAVLGGDALCIYAFELLCKVNRVDIILEISKALGTHGMIGGQVVDIESEGKTVDKETIEYIHNNKTAAFIRSSIVCGCLLANGSKEMCDKLASYGNYVGLVFQIVDDIMDEESTIELMGKKAGSDKKKGKATFPSIIGLDESKKYAHSLIEKAKNEISFLNKKGLILMQLADYIGTRMS